MPDVYDNRIMKILAAGPRSPEEISKQIGLGLEPTEERLYYLSGERLVHTLPSGAYAFGRKESQPQKSPQDEEHFC